MTTDDHILRLRQAIEEVACHKMQTPKDFDYLSELLVEREGERVSASTLKRIWGYVSSSSMPRQSTLDVLARFVGSKDWEDFCQQADAIVPSTTNSSTEEEVASISATAEEVASSSSSSHRNSRNKRILLYLFGLTLIILGAIFLPRLFQEENTPSNYILHAGDSFFTTDDYLRLFGIQASAQPWSEPLPHHNGIIVWGPEYLHPDWHNEGNADSLMPTITEYWLPADGAVIPAEVIATRNADNYLRATSFSELRITFMKGLGKDGGTASNDTAYTFLGIYRLDPAASDSTRLVWQRVAEECDLSNLDYLELLRH